MPETEIMTVETTISMMALSDNTIDKLPDGDDPENQFVKMEVNSIWDQEW